MIGSVRADFRLIYREGFRGIEDTRMAVFCVFCNGLILCGVGSLMGVCLAIIYDAFIIIIISIQYHNLDNIDELELIHQYAIQSFTFINIILQHLPVSIPFLPNINPRLHPNNRQHILPPPRHILHSMYPSLYLRPQYKKEPNIEITNNSPIEEQHIPIF